MLDFAQMCPKVSTVKLPASAPFVPTHDAAALVGSEVGGEIGGERAGTMPRFLADGLTTAIAQHLDQLDQRVCAIDHHAGALVAQCRALLAGGKRHRAALAYWSYAAHTTGDHPLAAESQQAVFHLGAALELFQASALFHDDLLDNSDLRRGQPTAHRAFATQHQHHGYLGDAAKFGANAAILLGDLTLALAYDALNTAIVGARLSDNHAMLARQYFSEICQEVIAGQYLDMLLENEPLTAKLNNQRAYHVISAKSASYSARYPLVLGAVFAGASAARLDQLSDIGEKIGTAFQLRDDVLGIFGNPAKTGKPSGDDLREGKRTVLLLETLRKIPAVDRDRLATLIGNPNLTSAELAWAQGLITNCGARAAIETEILTLATAATSQLAGLPLAEPGKSRLLELARALTVSNL